MPERPNSIGVQSARTRAPRMPQAIERHIGEDIRTRRVSPRPTPFSAARPEHDEIADSERRAQAAGERGTLEPGGREADPRALGAGDVAGHEALELRGRWV